MRARATRHADLRSTLMLSSRNLRLIGALGITQIVSWGTLYYAIAVLGESMRGELGISSQTLFGAYSLCLLISALIAPAVGRAIDRHGGRRVMSLGSVVAAAALVAIANVHSTTALYAAWALAGVAMAMTMYDAAFATLSQHTGTAYRSALTALTLMGGLASTVFWPVSLKGLEWYGWRETMVFFAVLEIGVCLPLHYFLVPADHTVATAEAVRRRAQAAKRARCPRAPGAARSWRWRWRSRSTASSFPRSRCTW